MKNKKKTVASVSFDHDLEDSISMVMPILTDCDPNEDFSEGIMSIDSTIPILALRNMVLLPGVAIPVVVGREKSMKLVRAVRTIISLSELFAKRMLLSRSLNKMICLRLEQSLKSCVS